MLFGVQSMEATPCPSFEYLARDHVQQSLYLRLQSSLQQRISYISIDIHRKIYSMRIS